MKIEGLIANRYHDDEYEYRHVQLPKLMLKAIPKEYHDSAKGTLKLLWEEEWRAMGMTQVRGTLFFLPIANLPRSEGRVIPNNATSTDTSFPRASVGSTTKFMSRSRISFFSSECYRYLLINVCLMD